MENYIYHTIKSILTENSKIVDEILDKINNVGYDNLSNFEKETLKKLSNNQYHDKKHTSIYDNMVDYLNDKYDDISIYETENNNKDVILILDKHAETLVEIYDRIMYIDHQLYKDLIDEFDINKEDFKTIITKWLENRFNELNVTNKQISFMFGTN
jgi:hypothetical protein